MSGTRDPDDAAMSDVPWALVFDPAVNARALGEIQARGFRAAAGLVDRFVTRPDRGEAPGPHTQQQTSKPPDSAAAEKNPDVQALLQSWRAILGQLAGSVGNASAAQPARGAAFDFVNSAATGHLVLTVRPAAVVSGEVWLHNSGPVDRGEIVLRCGDLLSHAGHVIGSDRVVFEPAQIAMPARCSRGVLVHVEVGADVPAGRYHAMLLVDGHPDIWLPIMLEVEPAAAQ
ncbi:hypothetical protein [Mycobacterium sp. DL592]|uniref:hypothetical protein n=1 Tax=Mycobacterium sp. DL592 TaxID=2675524 RepID=UPI00141FE26A|nr:hypothetical protein [Mycobacterium sp. DL592]